MISVSFLHWKVLFFKRYCIIHRWSRQPVNMNLVFCPTTENRFLKWVMIILLQFTFLKDIGSFIHLLQHFLDSLLIWFTMNWLFLIYINLSCSWGWLRGSGLPFLMPSSQASMSLRICKFQLEIPSMSLLNRTWGRPRDYVIQLSSHQPYWLSANTLIFQKK